MERYQIKQKIGSGGMATVHLARDTVLNRDVAVKMLHAHLLERPESIKRFRNEARVAATLSHDNIIRVFDYGEEDGRQYIVMEYINGTTLDEMVRTLGPLPNTVLLSLTWQVLCGLAQAHSAGVMHRDIKPANILVDTTGQARIADFGIAHLVNAESITLTGSFLGSPEFLSPEQADGKSLTDRTDIFSLGSALYFCATGTAPFAQENPHAAIRSILDTEPVPVMVVNRQCLQVLSDLVMRCLTKDPTLRPSAAQCIDTIEEFCAAHHLPNDRANVQKFRADSQNFAMEEKSWLFQHYRSQALALFGKKKMAEGVRFLSQARAFGTLPVSDEKFLRPPMLSAPRAVLLFSFLVAVAGIGYFVASRFQGPRSAIESTPVDESQKEQPAEGLGSAEAALAGTEDSTGHRSGGVSARHDSSAGSVLARRFPAAQEPRRTVDTQPAIPSMSPPGTDSAPSVPTQQAPGWVLVKSNPPWANIYIDGSQKGFTPKDAIFELPAGRHELAVRKGGYADVNRTIMVESADTTAVMVELTVLK